MALAGGAEALFGKTRLAVLSLFFTNPDSEFYLRQVTRFIKSGQGAVYRELKSLVSADILLATRNGRRVYYRANRDCPFFEELKSLFTKTSGVADVLRRALEPLEDRIMIAYIYGSFAVSRQNSRSDVDLVVIGDVSFGEIVSALSKTQEDLSREINPVVYSGAEYRQKSGSQHFTGSLKETDKVFLIGSADELDRLAE